MRNDDALLLDMLLAARKIQRFAAEMTFADFSKNEMMQSAVMRELQIIGEAARMITEVTRANCAEVNWQRIIGMRNRLVHEYFSISLEIVWKTVQTDIVPLITQLEQYVSPDLGLFE